MNFHRTNRVITPITHSNLTYKNLFAGNSEIFDRSAFDCGTAACPSFARGEDYGVCCPENCEKMKYLCVHIEVLQSFILSENCYCWKVLGASAKGTKIKLYLEGKLILVVFNPLTPRSDKGVTSP